MTTGASAPRAAQKKVNERTQRLLELFDNYDTEHRSELDVYQIGNTSSASPA